MPDTSFPLFLINKTYPQEKGSQREPQITQEHLENNQSVWEILLKMGVIPEELPPEEDIKKLLRKLASDEKKMAKKLKGF